MSLTISSKVPHNREEWCPEEMQSAWWVEVLINFTILFVGELSLGIGSAKDLGGGPLQGYDS